jgi:ribose 5-phosphate isomerase RpiB
MRVAVGSDHAGFALKGELAAHLTDAGHDVVDLGVHDEGRAGLRRGGGAGRGQR